MAADRLTVALAAAVLLLVGAGFVLGWITPCPRGVDVDEPEPAEADLDGQRTSFATAAALLQPDDPTLPDDDAAHIAAAVARAVDAYASYLIAVRTGMDPDARHRLAEAIYADLAESLTPPQLARALVIGLHPHADERARALLDTDRLSTADLESR